MSFTGFPPETFAFLKGLTKNNTKEWFERHRSDYEDHDLAPAKAFVEAMAPGLKKISTTLKAEPRVNGSIFRINRDVRFSKDKRPYKTTLDLWFWDGEERGWGRPGCFVRLLPDGYLIGQGMHGFLPQQLQAWRKAVVDDKAGAALDKAVRDIGGLHLGEAARKKVPRGFAADHPRAGFLKMEGLSCHHEAPLSKLVHSAKFVDHCLAVFAQGQPLSRWLLAHVVGR